jgi:hypothetical protein
MTSISSIADLTELGRRRLSNNFFMRDMLYSDVGNFSGIPNIPHDPELAAAAGEQLCQLVLEPLRAAFGHIAIRSAYRSPVLNGHCHELHQQGVAESWCSSNTDSAAHHIWDMRDSAGYLGAVATVVVPAYVDHFERTGDWQSLGWWIRDNLEHYAEVQFFRRLGAFNIRWYEGPAEKSVGFLDPPTRITLTKSGEPGFDGDHSPVYADVLGPLLACASGRAS